MHLQTQVLDTSFYELVSHASIPAKLVLIILLFFSLASWAIIINKLRAFRQAEQQNLDFLKIFRQSNRWSDVYPSCDQFRGSPLVNIFLAAYSQIMGKVGHAEVEQKAIDLPSMPVMERVLRRAAKTEIDTMEQSLSWLASIATSAPFIGLFGTVVGIIISFQGLSSQTQTSIQAVAPGIAEALIATAAGLFVAVPAYIGYNHFVARARRLTSQLDDFCLETLNSLDRSINQYGVFKP